MSAIGYFKKVNENSFAGEIITLSVQAKGVRIIKQDSTDNEKAPSHRVYIGRVEVGAGWTKVKEDGSEYISLTLDDPSFNAPIYASLLVEDPDSEDYTLVWSRPRK